MPKPTETYITNLTTRLTMVWGPTWTQWGKIDTYLKGTFELWPDDVSHRPKYHPPTAIAKIDDAVSTKLPQKPKIHRYGKDKSAREQNKADPVEMWLENMFAVASLQETQPTVPQAKRHMMAYGYAVVKGPWLDARALALHEGKDPEQKRGEGDKEYESRLKRWRVGRKSWNPIRISAPHPQRVLLHPNEKQPMESVEVVTRFKGDVWNLLQRKKEEGVKIAEFVFDTATDNYYEEIKTTEYWSEDWHSLLGAADEELYLEPNEWGFVPWAHAFSGWGMEPTDTTNLDPTHMAVGLLSPQILEALLLEAQQKTAKHNALVEAAMYQSGYGGDMKMEDAAQQLARDAMLKGKKEEWWFREAPQLPAWLFEVGKETADDIEAGTLSKGLGGHRRPGVTTVGQEAILDTQGSRKFDVPSGQIDHLFTIPAQNTLRLVEIVGEKITIRDVTIGPDDVQGNYAVEVTFQVDDDIMLAQKKTVGMQENEQGLIDDETYLTDTGRENAVEIMRKTAIQRMMRTDQVTSFIATAGLAEAQRRLGLSGGSGLLGPNGQPIQSQPVQPPAAPPVVQAPNPAVNAMQETVPGGVGAGQAINGQLNGVNNGAFAL